MERVSDAIYAALGCTHIDRRSVRKIQEAAEQIARFVEDCEEYKRLRAIEAAATAWRRSLENDNWAVDAIEDGACREGMAELLKLIPDGRENPPREKPYWAPSAKTIG